MREELIPVNPENKLLTRSSPVEDASLKVINIPAAEDAALPTAAIPLAISPNLLDRSASLRALSIPASKTRLWFPKTSFSFIARSFSCSCVNVLFITSKSCSCWCNKLFCFSISAEINSLICCIALSFASLLTPSLLIISNLCKILFATSTFILPWLAKFLILFSILL